MKDRLFAIVSRLSHQWSLPTEGKKYYFLSGFLLIVSFLIGLICFFPVNALKGSVEKDLARILKADVAIGRLTMELPFRIRASQVRAAFPAPIPYVLHFDTLALSPVWSSFFIGDNAFVFSGSLNQGHFEGEADENGNLTLNLRDVRFSWPVDAKETLFLGGVAREANFSGKNLLTGNEDAELVLNVDNLELSGARSLGLKEDVLFLGRLRLRGQGKGQTLRIEQLTLRDGAIAGDASGTFILRNPFDLSALRLTAVLRVDPAAGEVGTLLSLLKKPAADGSYPIRLFGTLRRPLVR